MFYYVLLFFFFHPSVENALPVPDGGFDADRTPAQQGLIDPATIRTIEAPVKELGKALTRERNPGHRRNYSQPRENRPRHLR